MNTVKHKVSRSKRRFIDEKLGVDLDLSYINDRIVAMGFPSEGSEGLYRNPMSEVQRLFELKHKDRYKVYNLCSERWYDHEKFHNRVVRYPFDDHNCPNFEDIWTFCEDVKAWLDEHPKNLAVVHCKAGKGRTGLMICCWLLYAGDWRTAQDAMKFYAAARTYNQKGVTIPSQIRYIHYFEQRLRQGPRSSETAFLSHVVLHGVPKNVQELRLSVYKGIRQVPLFHYKGKLRDILKESQALKARVRAAKKRDRSGEIQALEEIWGGEESGQTRLILSCNNVPVCGDIKFEFEKLMHFWINTGFAQRKLILQKSEIDKAHKDTKGKIYPSDFRVELFFRKHEELLQQGGDVPVAVGVAADAAEEEEEEAERASPSASTPKETAVRQDTRRKWVTLAYPSLTNL